MAIGRRCSLGCETWPDEALYAKCPKCGEPTTRYSAVEPLDSGEARDIRLAEQAKDAPDPVQVKFAEFYERHCRMRGIPVDGPLPPEYEARLPEARSLLG